MTVEEKPDVTYNDVGGCKEQIEKMREVCIAIFFFFPYYYSLGCISLFCENVDIHNAEIMNDFGDRYRSIHGWYVCITDRDCFLGC